MDELIKTFHIDWKLIIAQLINFAIVFAVLWKFALKPLMKTMSERTATIEKSLRDAEDISREREHASAETKKCLTAARQEALAILNATKKQADEKRQQMIAATKNEIKTVITAAKQQIQAEKESMLKEARRELAALVVTGVAKVLGETVNEKVDKKIVRRRSTN